MTLDDEGVYGTTGIFSLYLDNLGLINNDFEKLTANDIYQLPNLETRITWAEYCSMIKATGFMM